MHEVYGRYIYVYHAIKPRYLYADTYNRNVRLHSDAHTHTHTPTHTHDAWQTLAAAAASAEGVDGTGKVWQSCFPQHCICACVCV